MKKTSIILASSLIIMWTFPVKASIQEIKPGSVIGDVVGNDLNNLYNPGQAIAGNLGMNLDFYLNSMKNYLSQEIVRNLNLDGRQTNLIFDLLNREILEKLQGKVGDIFGVFGYPSPGEINREIPEIVINDDTEEVGEFTVLGKSESVIAAGEKQITDAYLESRLGKSAQQQKQQQLEAITQLANHSVDTAQDAASDDVTQDVLKRVAAQNGNQALISQAMYAELTQLGMNQNMSLQQLSKISDNLEQEHWQEKVTSTANRVSLVEAITQLAPIDVPLLKNCLDRTAAALLK